MIRRPPRSTLVPDTTLFRSTDARTVIGTLVAERLADVLVLGLLFLGLAYGVLHGAGVLEIGDRVSAVVPILAALLVLADRKSTRLNSSHAHISYAVFCLNKT